MSEGQKPMPDSKVKELSDMPWKQREESRTWQKERVIQELRSQGKRMTKQRMILLDVILSGKWNCCKEIYYEAAKRDAAIGMATVYRMVSTLEEIGGTELLLDLLLAAASRHHQDEARQAHQYVEFLFHIAHLFVTS